MNHNTCQHIKKKKKKKVDEQLDRPEPAYFFCTRGLTQHETAPALGWGEAAGGAGRGQVQLTGGIC